MRSEHRNRVALALSTALLLALSAGGAFAQTSRTVKLVVPYPPASGPDILSRLMADQVGRAQGVTIVVENRPGAGTTIGTEMVARAAPDGNTVLLVANSFVVKCRAQEGQLRRVDELRADLSARIHADPDGDQSRLALQGSWRFHRRRARQAR